MSLYAPEAGNTDPLLAMANTLTMHPELRPAAGSVVQASSINSLELGVS